MTVSVCVLFTVAVTVELCSDEAVGLASDVITVSPGVETEVNDPDGGIPGLTDVDIAMEIVADPVPLKAEL